MFIPGHLHLASASEVDRQAFDIHLRYRVLEAEARPVAVHFDMEGRIDGQPFSESFELPRDAAVHFASRASRLARRHGCACGRDRSCASAAITTLCSTTCADA